MTLFKYSMKKATKYMVVLLSIIILLLFGYSNTLVIRAEEDIDITTTSVRDDLESMDEDKLTYLSDDEFIFIAMSQYYDKEDNLRTYLYVNVPYDISIFDYYYYANISTAVMDENYNINEAFKLYPIKYINNEETWYKLEVLNLPNLEDTTRRYYIQDLRVYMDSTTYSLDNDLKEESGIEQGGSNNSSSESTADLTTTDTLITDEIITPSDDYIYCDEVSKVYIFNGLSNNTIEVFREEIEIITITEKEFKFYCYGDGANLLWYETTAMNKKDIYTDAWYVFFNTDKPIDELMEIELTYTQYDYFFHRSGYITCDFAITEAEIENQKNSSSCFIAQDLESGDSYIKYHEPKIEIVKPGKKQASYVDKGWFGKYDTYYEETDNIMDLRKYKEEIGDKFVFTEMAEKYTWAVNFKNTEKSLEDYESVGDLPIAINLSGSGMSDVAILRLKYKTNSIVHNAYAVDTPTSDFTGDSVDEETKWEKSFEENFEKILSLIALLILVITLGYFTPIFNMILNVLIKFFKLAFKGLLVIITAPFKLIGTMFKNNKKRK